VWEGMAEVDAWSCDPAGDSTAGTHPPLAVPGAQAGRARCVRDRGFAVSGGGGRTSAGAQQSLASLPTGASSTFCPPSPPRAPLVQHLF